MSGRNLENWKAYDKRRARTDTRRYSHFKSTAKYRKQVCTISYEEFVALRKDGKCKYCNSPLNETGSGLDRINSSLGYISGNCVPCCKSCNLCKGHLEGSGIFSVEEILESMKRRMPL